MDRPNDIARYLDLTRAHEALDRIGRLIDALKLHRDTRNLYDGEDDSNNTVAGALNARRHAAGLAAIGEGAPLDTSAETMDYHFKLLAELKTIGEYAEAVATLTGAVTGQLHDGLLTKGRSWSADDITEGAMLDAFSNADASGSVDPVWLLAAYRALARLHSAGAVNDGVFDRHMAVMYDLGPAVAAEPEHEHAMLKGIMDDWHEDQDEAGAALDVPPPGPASIMRASQTVHAAPTYARLTRYMDGLRGSGWDERRRDADNLLMRVSKRAYAMGTDARGLDRHNDPDVADLFVNLAEWRADAYAERMTAAGFALNTAALDHLADDAREDARNTAYLALYDAANLAVNTGHLLDVWQHAARLDDDQRANLCVSVILLFEESRTYTGAPLVDGGEYTDRTKSLRGAVDGYEVGHNSNLAHTVAYREHRDAIAALDMATSGNDGALCAAWGRVVRAADRSDLTRRQVRALRDLVNAKIAEWCKGDKRHAGAFAARLPEWDRIAEELAND